MKAGKPAKDIDLKGANLRGAYLEGANLADANLEDASLADAYLERVSLKRANLKSAYLEGAYLVNANLEGANLRGADLTNADLYHANLEGANLEGANLEGADLEDADLEGVKYDNKTVWPEGFSPPSSAIKAATTEIPAPTGARVDSSHTHQGEEPLDEDHVETLSAREYAEILAASSLQERREFAYRTSVQAASGKPLTEAQMKKLEPKLEKMRRVRHYRSKVMEAPTPKKSWIQVPKLKNGKPVIDANGKPVMEKKAITKRFYIRLYDKQKKYMSSFHLTSKDVSQEARDAYEAETGHPHPMSLKILHEKSTDKKQARPVYNKSKPMAPR